jgi:hypothetical protein
MDLGEIGCEDGDGVSGVPNVSILENKDSYHQVVVRAQFAPLVSPSKSSPLLCLTIPAYETHCSKW